MDEQEKLLRKILNPVNKGGGEEWKGLSDIPDAVSKQQESEITSRENRVKDLIDKIISSQGALEKPLYDEGIQLLSELLSDIRLFTNHWGTQSYEELIGLILLFWLYERKDNVETKFLQVKLLQELTRFQRQGKDRIKDRPDQVDKRAFQEAVASKLENYPTISAAADAFFLMPEFSKHPHSTISGWIKERWIKPKKRGRRKWKKGEAKKHDPLNESCFIG